MKTTLTLNKRLILSLVTMLMLVNACSKDDKPSNGNDTTSKSGYRILAYTNDSKGWGYYLLPFDNLMSGSITPVNYGYDVTGTFPFNGTFYHKGYYYFIADNRLNKFKVDGNGQLIRVSAAVFPYFSESRTSQWVDDHTLAMVGDKDDKVLYTIINVEDMNVTSSGELDIPFYSGEALHDPSNGAELSVSFRLNLFKVDNDKAVVGYSYYTWPLTPGVADVNYYAEFEYPSMKKVKISTDTQYGYSAASQFEDEAGNVYLPTSNIEVNNKKEGIYRIKKGESVPDPDYFFEASFKNDGIYSVFYIGNGKALLLGSLNYILVDVNEKKVEKNLADELPKLTPNYWSGYVLSENNKLYMGVLTQSEGTFIYEYDPSTGKLTRGLEVAGGIARLSLLHKVEGE